VGNDVVDLNDPETGFEALHPRWVDRVFTDAERRALDASPVRHRLHWALWAAKESGYKALRRLDPGAVFAPRAFEVELEVPRDERTACRGAVRHRGRTFALEVRLEAEYVHAVATATGTTGWLVAQVERAREEPGAEVRKAAAAALAEVLDLDAPGLRLTGCPPVVRHGAATLAVVVSLSHHGRFVAFAFQTGGPRTQDPVHDA
jgi:phosphopantetheinyl transferase (holo-ACP synthase)